MLRDCSCLLTHTLLQSKQDFTSPGYRVFQPWIISALFYANEGDLQSGKEKPSFENNFIICFSKTEQMVKFKENPNEDLFLFFRNMFF